jgi:uncharacterized protein YndB with AHSA1/START domain
MNEHLSEPLRLERVLTAPAERVWSHLTESDLLPRWLAAGAIPPAVGEIFVLRFDLETLPERTQHGAAVRGVVTAFDRPRVLEHAWETGAPGQTVDDDAPPNDVSIVRFELAPSDDRVALILTHRRVPDHDRARIADVWKAHLDLLAAALRASA